MEYFIGLLVASAVAGLAAGGFGRDRSFAPTILIVVAHYYVLFAIMGGSNRALVIESIVASGFLLSALFGGWLAWELARRSHRFMNEASLEKPGSRDARS